MVGVGHLGSILRWGMHPYPKAVIYAVSHSPWQLRLCSNVEGVEGVEGVARVEGVASVA